MLHDLSCSLTSFLFLVVPFLTISFNAYLHSFQLVIIEIYERYGIIIFILITLFLRNLTWNILCKHINLVFFNAKGYIDCLILFMTASLEWNIKKTWICHNQKMILIFIANNPFRWTMNSTIPKITVLDVKVVSLRNIKISWYLCNVIYANAGIFYVIYAIRNHLIIRLVMIKCHRIGRHSLRF